MIAPKRTLTPVFDGAENIPDKVGWYPTSSKKNQSAIPTDPSKWPRRYWDGRRFSIPVWLYDLDALPDLCKQLTSIYENHELYWCGLTAPYES